MDIQTNPATSMTVPFAERYDNFIGGKWTAPKDGRYFDNISSITGRSIGQVARSQAADVEAAPFFALLAELAARHDLPQLSMGMSDDFETAIMLGATYIRVGTALFGERTGAV